VFIFHEPSFKFANKRRCLPRAISHGLQFNGSLNAEKCRLIAAWCWK